MIALATPQLRWYQQEAVDAFFDFMATQQGDPLIVLPTGAGKSLTIGSIIARARANYPQMRVAILATQAELVEQNVKAAATMAPRSDIGIYSAGLGEKNAKRPITVANIQSLKNAAFKYEPFDLLAIDEAHTIADADSGMYRKFISDQRMQNPALRLVGLTATDYKLSSGRLTGQPNSLFSDVCYRADIVRLIAEKFLSRPIMPKPHMVMDTSGVALRGGDFIAKELAEAVDIEAVTEKACDEIARLAHDRKHILIFGVSIDHSRHLAEAMQRRGFSSALVHGELSRDERRHRIHAFTSGEVRVLSNCALLTTGFDFSAIDCVVLARPTKSAGLYQQMVGRGLRTHPDKENCLVIDLAGLVPQFGPIDAVFVPDKKAKKGDEPGEAVVKLCPVCESYQAAGVRQCQECNYEFPPPPVLLTPTASTEAILSVDIEPTWHDIDGVEYLRNPANVKKGKTIDTLRVQYKQGFRTVHSEFVCIEHTGFARSKAERWWLARSPELCPATIDQAIDLSDDLRRPTAIALIPQKANPQYQEICGYRFADDPPPPRPMGQKQCWSCALFDDVLQHCQKWDAQVPKDAQAEGCDAWSDFAENEIELPF